MNSKLLLSFSFLLLLVISIIPNPHQTATLAYGIQSQPVSGVNVDHTSDYVSLPNGTLSPYQLTQNITSTQIQTIQGSYIFNNSTCAMSFYNSSSIVPTNLIIGADRYNVIAEQNGTTTWINVNTINNAACTSKIITSGSTITISATKSVANAGIFQINYTKVVDLPLKLSFKAVNQNPAWTNYHIGLKEILNVPRFVKINQTTFDLSAFNNTVLNRSWITSHKAQTVYLTNNLHFDMGLSWSNVNDITIQYINNQAQLIMDYTFNTPILQPGQTILIDPVITTDNTSATLVVSNSGAATQTIAITIGSNTNRILLLKISHLQLGTANTNNRISTVKIGSTSFTLAVNKTTATSTPRVVDAEIWYLVNPPTGAQTITITPVSTATNYDMVGGAISLFNVAQTSPIGATATAINTAGTAFGIAITPTNARAWLEENLGAGAAETYSGNTDTLEWSSSTADVLSGAAQHKAAPTIGASNTISINGNSAADATHPVVNVALELKAVPQIPSPPTLNSVNQISTTSLNVTWASSTGATWYFENRTSPAGGALANIVNTTSLFHLDTGLTPGTQYQFGIQAGNASGYSAVSNLLSKYTKNVAPTALATSVTSSSAIRLTWVNPSGNFSGFKIEKESPIGGGWTTVSNTANSTNHFDVTGLLGSTQYNFRVSTNYATGSSDAGVSSPSSTANAYTLPNSPTGLTVTQNFTQQAILSWTSGGGNGTVLGYFVEFSLSSGTGTWNTLVANTGNSSTTLVSSNIPSGIHSYRVSAIKQFSTSTPSNTATKTIWQTFTVREFHRDNSTAVYGQAIQSNSSSTNNRFTLVGGVSTITGLTNNNNFTAWNALINFIVGKQYNYNATANHSLNMSTNDFDVDCPFTGTGKDVEVWTNGTDGHRITLFTTPTCAANNTLKWKTVFYPNLFTTPSYNTVVYVKILNGTYLNNATLKFNSTKVTTVLTNPYIISAPVTVGTGLQSKTFFWSMNLTIAPGFVPVNFTVGHISVSGSNQATASIKFSSSPINATATAVTVTFPSTFTMAYGLKFGNEGTSKTLSGLPVTSPVLGTSQSVITFKNPSKDQVTITAYDIPTNTTGRYILSQPNTDIPFVQQIKNWRAGAIGTTGMIGGIDIISLSMLIVAMIGLNRTNETLGMIVMVMIIGGASYFGLMDWPTTMTAAIALVALVIVSTTKKLPWS